MVVWWFVERQDAQMHTKLLLAAINFRPAAVLVVLSLCQIRARAEAGVSWCPFLLQPNPKSNGLRPPMSAFLRLPPCLADDQDQRRTRPRVTGPMQAKMKDDANCFPSWWLAELPAAPYRAT